MLNKIIDQLKHQYPEISHIDIEQLHNNPSHLSNLLVKEIKIFKNDIAPIWINLIKNEEKLQNNEDASKISKMMLSFIQMGHQIEEAVNVFTNKTKKHILEQNTKSKFQIISEDEFNEISQVFLDENQNFLGFVELLSSGEVPNLLCKEFNQALLKNKILSI